MHTHILPTLPGHWLAGSLPEFRADPLACLQHAATLGDLVHMRMGVYHVYLVNHPDLIHEALVNHPEQYHKSRLLKRATGDTIAGGLLTSEGDFHKRQRRMMQPAFHHQRIAGYAEIMGRRTAALLDTWRDGQQFDASQAMMKLTMQIVSEALFGTDVSADAEQIGKAISLGVEAVGSAIRSPFQRVPKWLPTATNRERQQASQYIRATVMSMIEARQKCDDLHERTDLLSMLLLAMDDETGAGMSLDQVYREALTLFIAGHETTAIALSWTLYLLSQHPPIEAALRAEIKTVLGDRPPGMADLPALKGVEAVVKEAMRLYPPAWIMGRIAVQDVVLGGYSIRAGSPLVISPYVTHRDPRWFADPLAFDPQRWQGNNVPRYAYLPFGGGPRVCIGQSFAMMEMQIILPMILQRCQLTLLPNQPVIPEPLVTLRQRDGLPMVVRRVMANLAEAA